MSVNSKYPSYFDQLPKGTNQDTGGINFERSCACSEKRDKEKTTDCVHGIPSVWGQGFIKVNANRIKMCDRDPVKRDTEGSDDLTEEDFELFRKPFGTEEHNRQKRSVNSISKDNATRYCEERLAETVVAKLCAKLGTNIQALVNVCSSDLVVSVCCI